MHPSLKSIISVPSALAAPKARCLSSRALRVCPPRVALRFCFFFGGAAPPGALLAATFVYGRFIMRPVTELDN